MSDLITPKLTTMSEIKYSKDGRAELFKGIEKVYKAVSVTLGIKGRNVIIGDANGLPHATKDGVTVANSIDPNDMLEKMGANVMKEVANATAEEAGDGTTSSTVLAYKMISYGMKRMSDIGETTLEEALQRKGKLNPMEMKIGIEKAAKVCTDYLKTIAKPIEAKSEQLVQIATISANNDAHIGKLIGEAFAEMGSDGIMTVEKSSTQDTYVKRSEGMHVASGFLSPFFVNNTAKLISERENTYVMVADEVITRLKEGENSLLPILEFCLRRGASLVIFAEDVTGEALPALIKNAISGNIQICCVKLPSYANNKLEIAQDIAAVTGAKLISAATQTKIPKHVKDTPQNAEAIKKVDAEIETILGRADKITSSPEETIILGGKGDPDKVKGRVLKLKQEIRQTQNEHGKKMMEERLASIEGGIGVIFVGATTEIEMKEKKDRIDDAMRATKAAISEGIVPGGGTAYIRCMQHLAGVINNEFGSESEQEGAKVLMMSLDAPLRQILENAGLENIDNIVKDVELAAVNESNKQVNVGYNAKTDQLQDLVANGVIDPAKVARVVIENASSVASIFLTTECVISR